MPTFKRKLFCNLLSKLNVNWSNKSCIQKKPSKKKTSRGWNMLKQPASTHTHRWSHVDPIGVAFMRKVFGTSFGIAWPKENHQLQTNKQSLCLEYTNTKAKKRTRSWNTFTWCIQEVGLHKFPLSLIFSKIHYVSGLPFPLRSKWNWHCGSMWRPFRSSFILRTSSVSQGKDIWDSIADKPARLQWGCKILFGGGARG